MIRRLPIVILVLAFTASCSRHYYVGEFEALNSSGEESQYLIEWQSTDMWFDFLPWKDKNTSVALHTKCSARIIQFSDRAEAPPLGLCVAAPGAGILFCGERGLDLHSDGAGLAERSTCGILTDADRAERILNLGDELDISIQCLPKNPRRTIAGTTIITEYLLARPQSYKVTSRDLGKEEYEAEKSEFMICP